MAEAIIAPFLTFEGKAEEAMNFYVNLFPNSSIVSLSRYGSGELGEGGQEGIIKLAHFSLNGLKFMCIDSPMKHDWGFTPAVSFFIRCSSVEEIDKIANALAKDGKIYMPLDTYPFAERFAWIGD